MRLKDKKRMNILDKFGENNIMKKEIDLHKYRLNFRHIIINRLRVFLRKILAKLPISIRGEHYLVSLKKYDKRAGSYIEMWKKTLSDDKSPLFEASYEGEIKKIKYSVIQNAYFKWLANTIIEKDLSKISNLIEIGAGELTTISSLKTFFKNKNIDIHASELSWSRINLGQKFFSKRNIKFASLSVASMLQLPYKDNSFDCVLTHYALEELTGYQEKAIRELVRISKKYVIIIEASFELGNKHQKRKLFNRNWNLEIIPSIKSNNWRLIKHSLVPYCHDPYHHGAIHIIEKDKVALDISKNKFKNDIFCCPSCNGKIEHVKSFFKCAECFVVYPSLENIPIFLTDKGIIASKFNKK